MKHLAFPYPLTIEHPVEDSRYGDPMTRFYDESAEKSRRSLRRAGMSR